MRRHAQRALKAYRQSVLRRIATDFLISGGARLHPHDRRTQAGHCHDLIHAEAQDDKDPLIEEPCHRKRSRTVPSTGSGQVRIGGGGIASPADRNLGNRHGMQNSMLDKRRLARIAKIIAHRECGKVNYDAFIV